jgi:phenylacetic acid degradation protein paaN
MSRSPAAAARSLVEKHGPKLARAQAAIRERSFWTPYPDIPSRAVYGDSAAVDGKAAFDAYLGREFAIDQPGTNGFVGDEVSPYGPQLRVAYPRLTEIDAVMAAASAAIPSWRDAGPDVRAAVCIEILDRLNARSFELANAVMHTTGQAFVMAFQAGGPHAQDRGLEAVAYAHEEMTRTPRTAVWEKPGGKGDPIRIEKSFRIMPRGVGLVVGCRTFPTWNSYPGLFANLATGNAVVVKPHRLSTLPLAITVAVCRDVLDELGFDPDLVCLAAEGPDRRIATELATHDLVKLVDFTGSSAFGEWLERNAHQAEVFTEKSGLNSVIIDSADDPGGMFDNLAFSLCLYSGQMCTTPQNIFIPTGGIEAAGQRLSFDEVAAGISDAIERLLSDGARAVQVLGAIVNDEVIERLDAAPSMGQVVLASRALPHPEFPEARVRTPTLVKVGVKDETTFGEECFGPVVFLIETESTGQSLEQFRRLTIAHGAITAAVYSTDQGVLEAAEDAAMDAGVALSCNLTGEVYVNQSAAFSDFHATGANPSANSCFTDGAFVARRFHIAQSRRPALA